MNSFQMGSVREEANSIHESIFNVLVICFADVSQLHRLLQVKCVKDWIGWREVKDILGKRCSNAFKVVIIQDFLETKQQFALLCQDAVMVHQYPSDASRRQELFDQGYTIGNCSGHRCNCLADSLLQLLLRHGVLKGPGGGLAIEKWRHDMSASKTTLK